MSAATAERKNQLVERDNQKMAVAQQSKQQIEFGRLSYYYNSIWDDEYKL
jgi:hypothetical protein